MKKKIGNFVQKYLRPFWFSSKCDTIKVPYVYGFFMMGAFFTMIIIYVGMAVSGRYSGATLASVAGVIATLGGLYFGTLKLYNEGSSKKNQGGTSDQN